MKRQAMYVSRSIQDRSLNYFFRGIAVNVKYSVCVCVCVCVCSFIYPARKAHAKYYVVICGLSDSCHILIFPTTYI